MKLIHSLQNAYHTHTHTLTTQIMAAMLRRHLVWLVIWGAAFGVILGVLNELLILTFRSTLGVIEF